MATKKKPQMAISDTAEKRRAARAKASAMTYREETKGSSSPSASTRRESSITRGGLAPSTPMNSFDASKESKRRSSSPSASTRHEKNYYRPLKNNKAKNNTAKDKK